MKGQHDCPEWNEKRLYLELSELLAGECTGCSMLALMALFLIMMKRNLEPEWPSSPADKHKLQVWATAVGKQIAVLASLPTTEWKAYMDAHESGSWPTVN